jgi:hypothetical protein
MAVTPYLKQGLKSLYLTLTSDLCEQQLLKKSGTLIEKMKIIKKKVILISFLEDEDFNNFELSDEKCYFVLKRGIEHHYQNQTGTTFTE